MDSKRKPRGDVYPWSPSLVLWLNVAALAVLTAIAGGVLWTLNTGISWVFDYFA